MLQWINHNNRKFLKTTAIWGMAVVFFVALFSIVPVSAQTIDATTLGNEYAAQTGLAGTDIRLIIANVVRAALGLVGLVMVILMMYAGYMWMTAGGNDEQIIKAKSIIKNAIIGLAIILSAYGIVSFVMKMMGIGDAPTGEAGIEISGPNTQNFQGSGALGTIIKDHYPMRNQEDVPRNTKIVVTFRRPVKLDSFVEDTNGNDVFGDCIDMDSADFKWETKCDQLKTDAGKLSNNYVNISQVVKTGENTDYIPFPDGVAVLATSTEIGGVKGIYTVVFRPNKYIGSTSEKFDYVVRLGNGIKLDDSINNDPSAFSVKILGNDYYEWRFSCSTVLDFDPPHVVSVYPKEDGQDYMNTALQITFNEPMDPTGLQGAFASSTPENHYFLQGENIFLKSEHSTVPLGSFNIVNNYQTLEFIPSKECGENTCGGKMYCMNVCNIDGGAGCPDIVIDRESVKNEVFRLVIKAATTINVNSFEAKPFTGAMDMAGNAMDSVPLGRVNAATITDPTNAAFFADNPDNFYWSFKLAAKMYNIPPSIRKVIPGLDAGEVTAKQDWKIDFAGIMLFNTLYGINIEEEPVQSPPICKVPRATFNIDTKTTLVNMFHCPFLSGRPMYYLPVLTSDLMEVHFNCLNPGKGPGGAAEVGRKLLESSICDEDNLGNCCVVDPEGKDADRIFCCNGIVKSKAESSNCVPTLKTVPSIDTLFTPK